MVSKHYQQSTKGKEMSPTHESSTERVKIINRPEHTRSDAPKNRKNFGEGEYGCGGPRDG